MANPSSQPQTISSLRSSFLSSLHSQFSSQTIIAYTQALHLFEKVVQKDFHLNPKTTSITKLKNEYVINYLQYLQDTRSVETEHLYSRAILAFCDYLETLGHIRPQEKQTLSVHIIQHRRPKQHIIPQLPLDAIEAILTYAATALPQNTKQDIDREYLRLYRDKGFLLTLAHTGLRVSEICDLRRHQIDPNQNTLTLLPEAFTLVIPEIVSSTIGHYLTLRQSLDNTQNLLRIEQLPIFARHDKKAGKKVLAISRWTAANIVNYWTETALPPEIKQILHSNNCSISPQTFRHYFIVSVLKRTGNIEETQTLARHTDIATTRRYLPYTESD